ncbi:MAG: Integral membrane sensor signal transduction histidine kinase [uncultured Sulfurovum sp.]|uniref:histidine kinase n=1 Tax=uncultured Sulfurovum sp. TaxID=269237 RepID=A0A6S6SVX2_9BACT|nr:MAG: Integral membrane sensor signal transduction histidine kinase [uncultured Sulfurovum sp.]
MKNLWNNFSDTYKISLTMLLLILMIQLGTLLYIWTFKSEILLEKERTNLEYQLDRNAKRLMNHLNSLQKELEFLALLEVMDDVLVNDIDKRMEILLEKKAKDLGQGIILCALSTDEVVVKTEENYTKKHYLEFYAPIVASFNKQKRLGKLVLLYPYENFMELTMDNPHQHLWLSAGFWKNSETSLVKDESIVVSKKLDDRLEGWVLSLGHEKRDALMTVRALEHILLWGFFFSLGLLLFVVWILSKKQINILEYTQEVLALKRTFLSTMSHELRTPLGSILNLTQHLMSSPKLTEENAVMLTKIESASEHLLSMINNLLQLSKIESNSMQVRQESVDIIILIEEMIEMLAPLIDEKELGLEKNLLTGQQLIVTDTNLLKQVLINLLSNAIKFTYEGSISIELRKENEQFVFRVRDTGIGIEKEKQSSLFSEFYQAHVGKEEIKHSTGLGLALSQKVAKLINGEITIQSEGIGQGCEATFRFSSL